MAANPNNSPDQPRLDGASAGETEPKEATNSKVLESEVKSSLTDLLKLLSDNSTISQKNVQEQLKEAAPPLQVLIAELQKSIFNAKAATQQGLLLKQDLLTEKIDQSVFEAEVKNIEIPSSALIKATAVDVPASVQKFLLSITSNPELKKQLLLDGASAGETAPVSATSQPRLDGASAGETASNNEISTPRTLGKIISGEITLPDGTKNTIYAPADGIGNPKKASDQPRITEVQVPVLDSKGEIIGFSEEIVKSDTALAALAATKDQQGKNPIDGTAFGETEPKASLAQPLLVSQAKKDDRYTGTEAEKFAKLMAKLVAQSALASSQALISIKPQPKIVSGARAIVKINGKVTALCTNVTYNINMDWQEVRGIDELLPNDLVPSSFSVTGSMSLYRVPNNSPIKNFIHSDMFRGVVWPYTTIEIRDKRTDELLVLIKRCAITSRSETYTHGQPVVTTMNFVGIGFRDEEVPELLPDELPGTEKSGGILSDLWNVASSAIKKIF